MKESSNHIYDVWRNIIYRCGNPKYPSYIDCSVCEEWNDFSNFCQWYNDNYYEIHDEKMCVDKDILFKGNTIYRPDRCCIVPETINMILTNRRYHRGELPIGVTQKNGAYMAKCKMYKKDKYIGYFDSPIEAFYAYKAAKESYIKEVADLYKPLIPTKIYDALINYRIDIND